MRDHSHGKMASPFRLLFLSAKAVTAFFCRSGRWLHAYNPAMACVYYVYCALHRVHRLPHSRASHRRLHRLALRVFDLKRPAEVYGALKGAGNAREIERLSPASTGRKVDKRLPRSFFSSLLPLCAQQSSIVRDCLVCGSALRRCLCIWFIRLR